MNEWFFIEPIIKRHSTCTFNFHQSFNSWNNWNRGLTDQVLARSEVEVHPTTILLDVEQILLPMPVADLSWGSTFLGSALDGAWVDRCAHLARAMDRLAAITSQEALILLRTFFGTLRVQHLLHWTPSTDYPARQSFDTLLRSALNWITNSDISGTLCLQASRHFQWKINLYPNTPLFVGWIRTLFNHKFPRTVIRQVYH
jgi:hypothetical protein